MLLRRLLGTAVVAVTASAAIVVPASQAMAAPNFEVPFPCGQTWSGQTRTNHSPQLAIDFNRTNDYGDPVVASAPGTVSVVRNLGDTSYGRYVVINHGGGYTTYYAHLSSWTVSVGQSVGYGTRIGYVGSTGGSTGPHLHYEQRYNGNDIRVKFDGVTALYYGTKNYTSSNACGGNPYGPVEVCGSAYSVVNSHGLVSNGVSYGKVYLLYNNDNGYNCVVTIKHRSVGSPSSTSAYLEPQGSTRTTDSGNFSYYAGPVKRYAANVCVRWGGSVNGVSFNSGWTNCG